MKARLGIILLVVALSSCSIFQGSTAKAGKPNALLAGTIWYLSALPGTEISENAKQITLTFDEKQNRLGGHNSCNSYGGIYTITGDKIRFSEVYQTLMACQDDRKLEQNYMRAIHNTTHMELKDDILKLKRGNEVLAIFGKSKK